MNGTRRLLRASLTVTGLLIASGAHAQAHLQGSIEERFSTSAPASTARIVGLTSGTFERPLDLSHIKLLLPGAVTQRICFFAVTRDGSYDARGILVAPRDAKGFAAIEQRSRYGRQLSSYSGADFAVRATIGVSCESEIIPTLIVAGDGTPPRSLRFQLQTRDAARVTISTTFPDGRKETTACSKPLDRANVSFDYECAVPVPTTAPKGVVEVAIQIIDAGGQPRTDLARILWPS